MKMSFLFSAILLASTQSLASDLFLACTSQDNGSETGVLWTLDSVNAAGSKQSYTVGNEELTLTAYKEAQGSVTVAVRSGTDFLDTEGVVPRVTYLRNVSFGTPVSATVTTDSDRNVEVSCQLVENED